MTTAASTGVSRRQWQRDRTMTAIEHAALPVLVRLGYEATTAEHLAEAAGVSVRTLFRYFPTGKDDVILAELRRAFDEFEVILRARPPDEPLIDALNKARAVWSWAGKIELSDAARLSAQIARDQPDLMVRLLGERQMLAERLVDFFGERLGLDPVADLRPRLCSHCYASAMITGWLAGRDAPGSDAGAMVDEAIRLLEPLFAQNG